jgi:hypothetical protein
MMIAFVDRLANNGRFPEAFDIAKILNGSLQNEATSRPMRICSLPAVNL